MNKSVNTFHFYSNENENASATLGAEKGFQANDVVTLNKAHRDQMTLG